MNASIIEKNELAWQALDRYLHLRVGELEIPTPYFTNEAGRRFGEMLKMGGVDGDEIKRLFLPYNNQELNYGWYRGKGSPEELEGAVLGLAAREGIDIGTFTPFGARNYMLLNGLGVDCSGFVYNVLKSVFGENSLHSVLDWKGVEREAYKAGSFSFAGQASEIVSPDGVQPFDLLLFRKPNQGRYSHVALILEKNGWKVVQSTSTSEPMGVGISDLKVVEGKLNFGFVSEYGSDWNRLYSEGRIELRRLKILK